MVPEPPGVMVPEPPVMVVPEPPVTVGEPPPPLAIPVIAPSTPAIEHDGEIMEKHYRRRRRNDRHQQLRMRTFRRILYSTL
jgi:hypothetical protein